jgi:hypothetical protein
MTRTAKPKEPGDAVKRPGPYFLDERTATVICKSLALGSSLAGAAGSAGVHPCTLGEWLARGRAGEDESCVALVERVALARASWETRALQQIEDAAASGAWQASAWKLERRIPKLYARQPIDFSTMVERLVTERLQAELAAAEDRAHGLATTVSAPAAEPDPDDLGGDEL